MYGDIRDDNRIAEIESEVAAREPYIPTIMKLVNPEKINEYGFEKTTVVSYTTEIDLQSVTPKEILSEMTEEPHVKATPLKRSFNAIGMSIKFDKSLSKDKSRITSQAHGDVIRQLTVLQAIFANEGAFGNNGLLNNANKDPYFVTLNEQTLTSNAATGIETKVDDLSILGNAISDAVGMYTGGNILNIGYYGAELRKRFSKINPNTGRSILNAFLETMPGKTINLIEIPKMELIKTTGNGLVILDDALVSLDVAVFPGIEDNDISRENAKEWTRYLVGSIQPKADAQGAMLLQPVTFAA